MKIIELRVDSFGAWSNLTLGGLDEGLNVLYGPNEAGKTTLLEFIRTVLYGFSPARRSLASAAGCTNAGCTTAGGWLGVRSDWGELRVGRHLSFAVPESEAEVSILDQAGAVQPQARLAELLGNLDEATFNNVFAVGLQELQELGSLSDTAAAQWLFRLSTGLVGVSLADVMRQLRLSRERLLSDDGAAGQVADLIARRARVRAQIGNDRSLTQRYSDLTSERERLDAEIARTRTEADELERTVRVLEAAVTVRESWQARDELDARLESTEPGDAVPREAVDKLDNIRNRLAALSRRQMRAKRRRKALRAEQATLDTNRLLLRHSARIEALVEQEGWFASLENQVRSLEEQAAAADRQYKAALELHRGEHRGAEAALGKLDQARLAALRVAARGLQGPLENWRAARREAALAQQQAETLSGEIQTALAGRSESEVSSALERGGNLVAQLRRRVQLDERLSQMNRHEAELDQQVRELLARQILPTGVLASLGGLFVVGVVFILAGLFMSESLIGSTGWTLAVLGMGGAGAAAAAKVLLERSAGRQVESCRKQSDILALQIKQAKDEREGLDAVLPRGGGPLLVRLQAAEKELASLEELLAPETRRQLASRDSDAAQARLERASQDVRSARRRWRDALLAARLPESMSPRQMRHWLNSARRLRQLQADRDQVSSDRDQRKGEWEAVVRRVEQAAADAGVKLDGGTSVERVRQLRDRLAQQNVLVVRRDELRDHAERLRRRQIRRARHMHMWRRRRAVVLRRLGVQDEAQLRRRLLEQEHRRALEAQRDVRSGEVAAALDGRVTEEDVRAWLEADVADRLESNWDEHATRLNECRQRLETVHEQRGRCLAQLESLAANRQPAHVRLEWEIAGEQLRLASRRWCTLRIAEGVLESVRKQYERDRQPATLQMASAYFGQLTEGRFTRVWTPLDEDVLCVEDSAGSTYAIESLSRGTREQLFLALRLALVEWYAKRGQRLPLVLDDVLVNFDTARARAAALVLRDFSAGGHQLLVFTCHEHIWKLFRGLKAATRRLPSHTRLTALDEDPRADEPVPRRRRGERPRQPIQPAAQWKFDAGDTDLIQIDELESGEGQQEVLAPYTLQASDDVSDGVTSTEVEDEISLDQPPLATPHQVTVVRGRHYLGPFCDSIWYDLVEDDMADSDADLESHSGDNTESASLRHRGARSS